MKAWVEEGREDRIWLRIGVVLWRRSVVAVRAAIVEKEYKGGKNGVQFESWCRERAR